MKFLVATAAKGIQNYVLRSDKLKEMVGASELVEQLCSASSELIQQAHDALLDKALHRLGWDESRDGRILTRVAGGARILFNDEQEARRFVSLWPLLVNEFAPGLELVQALVARNGNLGDDLRKAEAQIAVNRNILFPALPDAGPLVLRNPRSGLPASRIVKDRGVDVPVDDESARKRAVAEDKSTCDHLLRRLIPEVSDTLASRFPLDRFPRDLTRLVTSENRYVAIVHADANGLGNVLMRLADKLAGMNEESAVEVYRKFSSGIATAAEEAIRGAVRPILIRSNREAGQAGSRHTPDGKPDDYPFRPLVCAGDDVTVILRAEDALLFTRDYLDAFARMANQRLGTLGVDLPEITACAGIAFVKVAHPFAQAYELAEGLCKHAKTRTGRKASAIAFHRLTTSVSRSYQDELTESLTRSGEPPMELTMNPYVIGGISARGDANPRFGDLLGLIGALKDLPRGSLRQLASAIEHDPAAAGQSYHRILEVARDRIRERGPERAERLQAAIATITGDPRNPWTATGEAPARRRRTPLLDAIDLRALNARLEHEECNGNNTP